MGCDFTTIPLTSTVVYFSCHFRKEIKKWIYRRRRIYIAGHIVISVKRYYWTHKLLITSTVMIGQIKQMLIFNRNQTIDNHDNDSGRNNHFALFSTTLSFAIVKDLESLRPRYKQKTFYVWQAWEGNQKKNTDRKVTLTSYCLKLASYQFHRTMSHKNSDDSILIVEKSNRFYKEC